MLNIKKDFLKYLIQIPDNPDKGNKRTSPFKVYKHLNIVIIKNSPAQL